MENKNTWTIKWLKVETYMELHYVLAPLMTVSGIAIIIMGALLAFWTDAPVSEIKQFKIDHSLRVMLMGLILILIAHTFTIVDAYNRVRGRRLEIDLKGVVKKSDLKRSSLK
jgi:membrane-bound ClpP family serine protease